MPVRKIVIFVGAMMCYDAGFTIWPFCSHLISTRWV